MQTKEDTDRLINHFLPVAEGPSALQIAREYFPEATEEEIEYVIWEQTGFPSFWQIHKDGATPEECFRKQLAEFAASVKEGQS